MLIILQNSKFLSSKRNKNLVSLIKLIFRDDQLIQIQQTQAILKFSVPNIFFFYFDQFK